MNEEILNNIWSTLSDDNMTTSDFDTWKNNFLTDPEVPSNVYNYLRENKLTDSSPDEWIKNISTTSPTAEPSVVSESGDGSSVLLERLESGDYDYEVDEAPVESQVSEIYEGAPLSSEDYYEWDKAGRPNIDTSTSLSSEDFYSILSEEEEEKEEEVEEI